MERGKPAIEAVRKKINALKEQVEIAEEKTKEIEAHIRLADQRLEVALKEKEALIRKLKLTEGSNEKSQKLYQASLEKLQDIHAAIDKSERKRKTLEQKEEIDEKHLTIREQRLKDMKVNVDEKIQLLDEARRRKELLQADLKKTMARLHASRDNSKYFEAEIQVAGGRLRDLERKEVTSSSMENEMEDGVRNLGDQLRQSQEKWFIVHDKYKSLERVKEQMDDEVNSWRIKTRDLRNELDKIVSDMDGY